MIETRGGNRGFRTWVALKYEQYNITRSWFLFHLDPGSGIGLHPVLLHSVLYMMDAWERVIFNVIFAG